HSSQRDVDVFLTDLLQVVEILDHVIPSRPAMRCQMCAGLSGRGLKRPYSAVHNKVKKNIALQKT
ncbi:MAG: hypothetical protein WBW27_11090, partial [Pseudolabrys sp.]